MCWIWRGLCDKLRQGMKAVYIYTKGKEIVEDVTE